MFCIKTGKEAHAASSRRFLPRHHPRHLNPSVNAVENTSECHPTTGPNCDEPARYLRAKSVKEFEPMPSTNRLE